MLSYGALHVSENVLRPIFSGQVIFLGLSLERRVEIYPSETFSGQVRFLELSLGRHVSYLDSLLFLACSFDFKFFDSSHDVIE